MNAKGDTRTQSVRAKRAMGKMGFNVCEIKNRRRQI